MDQPNFGYSAQPHQQPYAPPPSTAPTGAVNYNQHVDFNSAGAPAQTQPEGDLELCGCRCRRNYPNLLRIGAVLTCIGVLIFQFTQFVAHMAALAVPDMVVSAYVELFAGALLLTELRFIEFWRKCTLGLVRKCYFINTYFGRGLFYIFEGSLILESTVGWILGITLMVIGVLHWIVLIFFRSSIRDFQDELDHAAKPSDKLGLNEMTVQDPGHSTIVTMDNMRSAAAFYSENKEHFTKENIDKAAKVGKAAYEVQQTFNPKYGDSSEFSYK